MNTKKILNFLGKSDSDVTFLRENDRGLRLDVEDSTWRFRIENRGGGYWDFRVNGAPSTSFKGLGALYEFEPEVGTCPTMEEALDAFLQKFPSLESFKDECYKGPDTDGSIGYFNY